MKRFLGWLGVGAGVLLGIGFAVANAGREVTLGLGLFTLYGVPVTFVAFGGVVVGMAVVLVAGINADLKVRRLLRERHMEDRRLDERGQPRTALSGERRPAPRSQRRPPAPGEQRKGESLLE